MRIIAIESTCDETGVSVLENGKIKSDVLFSQGRLHEKYFGVVPELASRAHLEKIGSAVRLALKKAGAFRRGKGRKFRKKFDAVAFSRGPGLPGALLVGRMAAETLAKLLGCHFMGVNHLEGHFFSCDLSGGAVKERLKFPTLVFIVSGGHTELWNAREAGRYRLLGATRDDAAGEAFDKIAKLLGLGYPGGPLVEKAAKNGKRDLGFPRPHMEGNLEFSFSGLKTAVAYYLRDNFLLKNARPDDSQTADICFSFQEAVTDTLVKKVFRACEKTGVGRVAVGGGVSANAVFRRKMREAGAGKGVEIVFARKRHCSDNAAMIAAAALRKLKSGRFRNETDINPGLKIGSWRPQRSRVFPEHAINS